MPNVNDIYGDFLKQEHLTRPAILTITETGITEFQDGKKQIVLHFKGTDKVLGLNVTNANFCADAFANPNSDEWIGRQIEVYADPNVMWGSKRVGGVRIRLPNGPKSDVPATEQPNGPGRVPLSNQEIEASSRKADADADFDDDIPF